VEAKENPFSLREKARKPSPSGRRPGRGDIKNQGVLLFLSPLPNPLPEGEGVSGVDNDGE